MMEGLPGCKKSMDEKFFSTIEEALEIARFTSHAKRTCALMATDSGSVTVYVDDDGYTCCILQVRFSTIDEGRFPSAAGARRWLEKIVPKLSDPAELALLKRPHEPKPVFTVSQSQRAALTRLLGDLQSRLEDEITAGLAGNGLPEDKRKASAITSARRKWRDSEKLLVILTTKPRAQKYQP